MKQKGVIVVLSLLLFFLCFRLYKEGQKEIVNLDDFTMYYESSLDENGGFAFVDSFYTFDKTYTLPTKVLQPDAEKEEEKEGNKKEEKPEEKKESPKYPSKQTYVVKKGDTPAKIAKAAGISLDALKANNPNLEKNMKVGSKLVLPSEEGVFYKIQKGDSISRISLKYNVKKEDILKYNNINPKKMVAGTEIFLKIKDYKTFLEADKPKLTAKEKDKQLKAKQQEKDKKEKESYVKSKKPEKTEKPEQIDTTEVVESAGEAQEKEKVAQVENISSGSGGFGMPVRYAGVSSPFGNRFHPVLRRYILHSGVDLVAKYVPLRASKAGVVTYAGTMSGYGKIIIIQHGDGFETRYAHLSQISTRVGERVAKGELIGKTGNSGRSTGPHLHFEIRKNGKPLNPMKYL